MAEFVEIDGRRLDCRVIGDGDAAPSLVFLHEGLGSIELWRTFPTDVIAGVGERAVVYSRYGHGWSDVQHERRPIDFMDREALVVLPELLEAAGVVDPILIGHSDGASIALIHAARHAVAGLVLLAPHVFVEGEGLGEIVAARARFAETDLAERMAKYHRDPAATFDAWADVWLDPAFRTWNIEGGLADVECPVLLIQGLEDEYGTETQIDAIASRVGGPADRLLLAGCGHSPHLDRPDLTAAVTTAFVQATRAGD